MRSSLFVVSLIVLCGCARLPLDEDEAVDGVIDLTAASFERPIALSGTWMARSGADPVAWEDSDFVEIDWRPATVPGLFEQQGFDNEGVVWYRLHLRLPPDAPALSGYLKYARNANLLYVSVPGEEPVLVGRSGRPSTDASNARLSRRPYMFNLPATSDIVLLWQVANYDYHRGGVPMSIVIAPPHVLHRWLFHREMDTLLISGIYLMLMVFFAGYWVWNRRNTAALTVSLLALVTMVRAIVVEGYFELSLGDAVTFHTRVVIEAITFFLLPGLTLLTMWALYPKEYLQLRIGRFQWSPAPFLDDVGLANANALEKPPVALPWRRINSLVLFSLTGVGVVFSLIALFASTAVTTQLLTVFRGLTLAMICLTPFVLIQIVERRRPMAWITISAFAIILASTVHDILMSMGMLTNSVYIAPYGLLALLLLQGYIVARRSAQYAHIVREQARNLQAEVERQTKHLTLAIKASEAANAAKTQFLNAVSHEIRTPLTSIIGFTQILEEELGPRANSQDLEFVHLIRESGDRLLRLVNDLLDLAKIETGRLDLDLQDVPVDRIISDVVRQSFPTARTKSLTLTSQPAPQAFVVRADPMRLHQVLLNLVTNALKFTEEGGVHISVQEAVLAGPDEVGRPAVAIRVTDTGCGMSREFLPYVFDRFTQELRASRTTIRGTGLGLALTRELVLRMNGRIQAESEVGKGSVFTVTLPLTTSEVRSSRPAARERAGDGASSRDMRNPMWTTREN